ncbi:ExbD/TolR family protein [Marinobacterium mangrovicola]|uniref:Biopolymer transport protein ExbD n=1 Tax=Marinobacterium mangrovicola TaxID=1476959 RepID=A0A4R1GNI0_9GAMM|nr:biopolymer transporter ExbD [Marinobacterium mangrovicola]TCK08911.1 biopolymer transport protein ExbD [Marinobacterium mangrovicola]
MHFQRQRREEVSINLTPLIDVVFLLLIFFMVSTTFTKETHLDVDLPQASNGEAAAKTETLDVVINAQGQYSVNGRALVNTQAQTLKRAIAEEAGEDRSLPFIITADAQTPHQSVVTAMDVAGQLGFIHLSISTREVESR